MSSADLARPGRRLLRDTASITAVIGLCAGVPVLLLRYADSPLPGVPDGGGLDHFLTSPLTDEFVLTTLTDAVWLLWAGFALALTLELTAALRGTVAPKIPGLTPLQALAAALVGTATIALVPIPARTPGPSLKAHTTTYATTLAAVDTADQPAAIPTPAQQRPHTSVQRARRTHRVQPGESLWKIAEHHLGHGDRWPDIYHLNVGRPQPGGGALHDPDLIEPGWVLLLPSNRTAPSVKPPHRTKPRPIRTAAPATPAPKPATPHPSATPRPAPPTHAPAGQGADDHSRGRSAHITLPSGSTIGATLIIGLAAAITLAQLQRRRRRIPSTAPGTTAAEPALTPTLAAVRRAHLESPDALPQPSVEVPEPVAEDASPFRQPNGAEQPDAIQAATDGTHEILLHLDHAAGAGLIGDGATAAARCLLVTLLSRRSKDHPEVLITQPDCEQLFGRAADLAGLTLVTGLSEALARMEAEIIHRGRLLETADTADFAAFRTGHPDEPLPTILLVTGQPDTRLTDRAEAVLALGRSLGIVGIVLGQWPSGTCTVDADGTVTSADGVALHHLTGTRMFGLTQGEAAEILATLAAAHASPEPEPAHPVEGPPRPLPAPTNQPPTDAHRVRLKILGSVMLEVDGTPIPTGQGFRRKGLELLLYLTLHPDGATTETLCGTLWPDTALTNASNNLYSVTSNIRKVLRTVTGLTEQEFLTRFGDRYQLDTSLISTDYWDFRNALARAAHAESDEDKTQALQDATSGISGQLTAWPALEWLEPARETLRHDIVDTITSLAELLRPTRPDRAVDLYHDAIRHDPYGEELYRQTMRLQATLDRPDAVRRTYQLLETRLTELDAEPDPETAHLRDDLLQPTSPHKQR